MATLLFPGRHLLHTCFQEQYLASVLQKPLPKAGHPDETITLDKIVFAITSSNQENSRYNPIPFHVRAIGVDRFARQFRESLGVQYRILGIPHLGQSDHFIEHLLTEIKEQTEGDIVLNPENTVVLCSTPELIQHYMQAGFTHLLPAELEQVDPAKYRAQTPMQLVKAFAESDLLWSQNIPLLEKMSVATQEVWRDFPQVPKRIQRLYKDPLLTESGDLTSTRNYSTYAFQMGHQEIINVKYQDIKPAITPGRIVDEGCADGALLVKIADDFPDSDLLGIEITGEFVARAKERQRAGEFKGTYIHFHQRNLLDNIFEPESIDTTICNSTMHELWSYGDRKKTIGHYLHRKFQQLRRGGRLIIRDVVGPENKDKMVYLWCNPNDGEKEETYIDFEDQKDLADHLKGLSTHALFPHFALDFLADEREQGKRDATSAISVQERNVGKRKYYVLPLKDAAEFMTKKDYVENWKSEMHEEFTFWSFSEWKRAVMDVGFKIVENPNHPELGSRVYTNPWIVENRWKEKVALYRREGTRLLPVAYPPTTMVLIAEKR